MKALFLFLSTLLFASDSMIHGPAYTEIVKQMEKLAQDHPETATLVNYGTSATGLPLVLIKIRKKDVKKANAPAVFISGATHGYEYLGVEDKLPRWFLQNTETREVKNFLEAGGAVYLVPILNPDGYEGILNPGHENPFEGFDDMPSSTTPEQKQKKRNRWNGNKVDLNRDYDLLPKNEKKLTQPETQAIARYLEKDLAENDLKLRFALNYHCCGRWDTKDQAQLGYPWAYTLDPIPEKDLAEHKLVAAEIEKRFLNTDIVSGSWSEMLYEAQGTAEDYFYAKYGAVTFVFEGLEAQEYLRLDRHTEMWKFVLEYVLNR